MTGARGARAVNQREKTLSLTYRLVRTSNSVSKRYLFACCIFAWIAGSPNFDGPSRLRLSIPELCCDEIGDDIMHFNFLYMSGQGVL